LLVSSETMMAFASQITGACFSNYFNGKQASRKQDSNTNGSLSAAMAPSISDPSTIIGGASAASAASMPNIPIPLPIAENRDNKDNKAHPVTIDNKADTENKQLQDDEKEVIRQRKAAMESKFAANLAKWTSTPTAAMQYEYDYTKEALVAINRVIQFARSWIPILNSEARIPSQRLPISSQISNPSVASVAPIACTKESAMCK
jgi:hypothetical protein